MNKLKKIIFALLVLFNLTTCIPVHAITPEEQALLDQAAAAAAAAREFLDPGGAARDAEAAAAQARYEAKVEAAAAEARAYQARKDAEAAKIIAEQRGVAEAERKAAAEANPASTSSPADIRTAPAGYESGAQTGIPGILPKCAFLAYGCSDPADADINIFVQLGINLAKLIFSIIGTVAFVMFVYGGFTMILAFGSSEKFEKGKNILVAAVVGMIIAFGAYLIVNFVLDVFQVNSDFRIIK